MIDNEFNPYDEIVASRQAIVNLEKIVREIVDVVNAQARLLEDSSKAHVSIAEITHNNCTVINQLRADLKLCRSYINQLEAQVVKAG